MEKLSKYKIKKGKIFNNVIFEFFTKTNYLISILFYGSLLIILLFINFKFTSINLKDSLITYFTAIFCWTFYEYLVHRYVFHFINEHNWSKTFHRIIHGIHHEFPRDDERLFMPPLPGTIILFLVGSLFYLIFDMYAFIFLAGFINGWGIYVAIHYFIHAYKPIAPFIFLWTHHAKHHSNQPNKAFGVSSPFWDYIFGTLPK